MFDQITIIDQILTLLQKKKTQKVQANRKIDFIKGKVYHNAQHKII